MEEEEETKKPKVVVEKPSHTKGDMAIVAVSSHTIVHTAAARASDRVLPGTIKLYPPVYNDLTKEVLYSDITAVIFYYFKYIYTAYISLLHSCYNI